MTQRWSFGLLCGVLVATSAACAHQPRRSPATAAVVRRAPTDLRCTNVEVTKLSKTAYVARGCDSEISYTCRCVEFGMAPYNICQSTACTPDIVRLAETSGGSSATQASGCEYDTQCKGDRICRAGQCVDPIPGVAPTTSLESDPYASESTTVSAQ